MTVWRLRDTRSAIVAIIVGIGVWMVEGKVTVTVAGGGRDAVVCGAIIGGVIGIGVIVFDVRLGGWMTRSVIIRVGRHANKPKKEKSGRDKKKHWRQKKLLKKVELMKKEHKRKQPNEEIRAN